MTLGQRILCAKGSNMFQHVNGASTRLWSLEPRPSQPSCQAAGVWKKAARRPWQLAQASPAPAKGRWVKMVGPLLKEATSLPCVNGPDGLSQGAAKKLIPADARPHVLKLTKPLLSPRGACNPVWQGPEFGTRSPHKA